MGRETQSGLPDLQESIGYDFRDAGHLELACTHASFDSTSAQNNERLEFLGDRVLGVIISEMVYTAHPTSPEGDLARRYNALVRAETCADVARLIDLGRYLKLGRSEIGGGGREKPSLLGNACEALIGAIYLDGGLDEARRFVHRFWSGRIKDMAEPEIDAKTTLQEWAQAQGLEPPVYSEKERTGPDHAPQFTMSAVLEGWPAREGTAAGKRAAEQIAARALLIALDVWSVDDGG